MNYFTTLFFWSLKSTLLPFYVLCSHRKLYTAGWGVTAQIVTAYKWQMSQNACFSTTPNSYQRAGNGDQCLTIPIQMPRNNLGITSWPDILSPALPEFTEIKGMQMNL